MQGKERGSKVTITFEVMVSYFFVEVRHALPLRHFRTLSRFLQGRSISQGDPFGRTPLQRDLPRNLSFVGRGELTPTEVLKKYATHLRSIGVQLNTPPKILHTFVENPSCVRYIARVNLSQFA